VTESVHRATHPGGGPELGLRLDPGRAEAAAGFDYFAIGVPTRPAAGHVDDGSVSPRPLRDRTDEVGRAVGPGKLRASSGGFGDAAIR